MEEMKIYLFLILNIIINKPTPGHASIDFVNKTNQVVVGATDLHFRTINRKVENNALLTWWLNIHLKHLSISYAYCDLETYTLSQYGNIPINNTDYLQAASCENYNTTYFKSMVIVGPIPANTSRIRFEIGNAVKFSETLISTYCPDLTKPVYLKVYNANNAVYNQQARFSCSKGELYDGSSINPDYYRTCQFDATWSGEMPQCWIAPKISITSTDKLISQQNVSFSCEVIEGNPESFNITINLISNIVSKYNVGINQNVVLPVVLTPDMNGAALLGKVRNAYKETIVKKTLNVLYGPISNNRVLYAEATYGQSLNVSLTFTANPTINGTTTNLTKIDVNIAIVNTIYQIRSLGGVNHVFEWKIDNFTTEYEGNYRFTAWSLSAPEVLVKSFELKVGSSSTTLPPTISTTTTSDTNVASGGISTEALIGIAVGGSVLLISVVIVVFVVFKRKNKPGTIPRKPTQTIDVQETPIYQNQLTDSPGIEPKYVEISREQKELHEDPMPKYENTKHVTYENVKRNLR